MQKIRVLLADDHVVVRQGLRALLTSEEDIEIVAEADNGRQAVQLARKMTPDVAVLDVRLPPTFTNEGLVAATEARKRLPGLPVLVLSQYVEPLYARELLADHRGGVGYLLKDRVMDVGQFIDAVRRVGPEFGARLLDQLVEPVAHASPSAEETLENRTSSPASDGSSRSIASISRRA